MSQRMQMVATALMLMTCVGMFWMTSTIASQGREMNAALMARLEQLAHQPPAAANPEWNPTVVQLVSESGEPLPKGFTVHLGCEQLNFKQQEQADASGRADFGLQRPGTYEVRVLTPSGEWSETIERPLRAGRPFDLKITCPTEPSEIQAPIVLNWPQTLDSPDLLIACQVEGNQRVIDGLTWGWHSRQQFLLDRSGKIVPYSDGFQDLFPPETSDVPVPNGQWLDVKPAASRTVKLVATKSRDATIGLPVQFSPVVKIALMKFQDAQPDQPAAVQIGQTRDAPIELDRGKSAHWTFTIPDRFEPVPDDEKEAALPHPAPAG